MYTALPLGNSGENRVFHGKIEFIRDLVTYEGTDVDSLEAAVTSAFLHSSLDNPPFRSIFVLTSFLRERTSRDRTLDRYDDK